MAYYDALAAKWATLSGAPASTELVNTAQAAVAVAPPARGDFASSADFLAACDAWRTPIAALFADPAVAAKLSTLATETVTAGQQPAPIASAVAYLREQGAWLGIKASTSPAALSVIDLYDDPRAQTLDFTLPIVGEIMASLVAGALITQDQANGLTSLSQVSVPWWEGAGYTAPISASDLEAAFVQSAGAVVLV